MNRFLETECGSNPELSVNPYCLSEEAGSLSQVSDIFMLPINVAPPSNWSDLQTWRDYIDNSSPTGERHIVGMGGIPRSQKYLVEAPRLRSKKVGVRLYTLDFDVIDTTDENYNLARRFQTNKRKFRFWYANLSGKIFGGKKGIIPSFVDADLPLERDGTETEIIYLKLEWLSDGEPDRKQSLTGGLNDIQISSAVRVWGSMATGPIEAEPDGEQNAEDSPQVAMTLVPAFFGANVWGEDENNVWAFD